MTFPKVRLIVSAGLFLGWIGFLFYLVIITPTTILSKPQFLLASLYIVADVRAERGLPNPQITITEVLWAADPADRTLAGQTLDLAELAYYQKQQGYEQPGKYLLPLLKVGSGTKAGYLIAPIPRQEGYFLPTMLATVEVFGRKESDVPRFAVSTIGLGDIPGPHGPLAAASALFARREISRENILRSLSDSGARQEDLQAVASRLEHPRFAPVVAVRRLPVRKAEQFVRELRELGVEARTLKEDVRIYPWRPEVQGQVEAIVKSKR